MDPFVLAVPLTAMSLFFGPATNGSSDVDGNIEAANVDDRLVRLEERVDKRWLSDLPDKLPLQSDRWRKRLPRKCRTRGGYRLHCQGRRDVPTPHGAAAELARKLGLGHRAVAVQLRTGRAFPEWIAFAKGIDDRKRLTFPVPDGYLGRGYGKTRRAAIKHRKHLGVDIGGDEGSPILAARGGLVVFSDDTLTGYGNAVMILHGDNTTTFYAHCKSTEVFPGQLVRRGQVIATVGETGFANAPHLHFEWRQRGWARDPAPHFLPRAESQAYLAPPDAATLPIASARP